MYIIIIPQNNPIPKLLIFALVANVNTIDITYIGSVFKKNSKFAFLYIPSFSCCKFLKTIYVNIYSNINDIIIADIPSIVIITLVSLNINKSTAKYPI